MAFDTLDNTLASLGSASVERLDKTDCTDCASAETSFSITCASPTRSEASSMAAPTSVTLPFASSVTAFARESVSCTSLTALLAAFRRTLMADCDDSTLIPAFSSASSTASTAACVTVPTNVEFIVCSIAEAPMSVILGDTGPSFSLTKYCS